MSGFIPWKAVDASLRAGRPHAVPVWYVWDRRRIYFITRRDMQKARNLATQPWVVVHAGDGDDVIILEGRVSVVTDRAELDRVDAMYREKYVDPYSGARDTIFHEHADLYCVHVEHAMAWMYGAVSTRTDWRFP